jgi:hypothetical protein
MVHLYECVFNASDPGKACLMMDCALSSHCDQRAFLLSARIGDCGIARTSNVGAGLVPALLAIPSISRDAGLPGIHKGCPYRDAIAMISGDMDQFPPEFLMDP